MADAMSEVEAHDSLETAAYLLNRAGFSSAAESMKSVAAALASQREEIAKVRGVALALYGALESLLDEISEPVFDDTAENYVEVQVTRGEIEAARAALKETP